MLDHDQDKPSSIVSAMSWEGRPANSPRGFRSVLILLVRCWHATVQLMRSGTCVIDLDVRAEIWRSAKWEVCQAGMHLLSRASSAIFTYMPLPSA